MSRRSRRHPALETAVFVAALLLSAFLAREFWRRWTAASAPAASGGGTSSPYGLGALNPAFPPLPPAASPHLTEQAVTGVAPIKLQRVQRRRPKPAAVPAPQ